MNAPRVTSGRPDVLAALNSYTPGDAQSEERVVKALWNEALADTGYTSNPQGLQNDLKALDAEWNKLQREYDGHLPRGATLFDPAAAWAGRPGPPVGAGQSWQDLPPRRREKIEQFARSNLDHGTDLAVRELLDALQGRNAQLGPLSRDEQRVLLSKAFDQWDKSGSILSPSARRYLSAGVYRDPNLTGMVIGALADHGIDLLKQSAPSGNDALFRLGERYAGFALQTATGSEILTSSPQTYAALRQSMERAGPEAAAAFALALNPQIMHAVPRPTDWQAQTQLLTAMNGGPITAAAEAVTQTVFANLSSQALEQSSTLSAEMSMGLARLWNPHSPAAQTADAQRLEGIFRDSSARQLLADGPLYARINTLSAIHNDPSLNAESLRTTANEPYRNQVLVNSLAHMLTYGRKQPGQPTAGADESRIAGILSTKEGWSVLMGTGPSDTVPGAAREQALEVLLSHPSITSQTLTDKTGAESIPARYPRQAAGVLSLTSAFSGQPMPLPTSAASHTYISSEVWPGDGWTNKAITAPLEQAAALRYLEGRGDAPLTLQGPDLENTVGLAMHAQPTVPRGMSAGQLESAMNQGALRFFSSNQAQELLSPVLESIRDVAGGKPVQLTVLPITFSSPASGPVELPLFRVTGTDGQEWYVDNKGARYGSFNHWLEANQLPSGTVTYPENGHLTTKNGELELGNAHTPKTIDTDGKWWLQAGDRAALAGGLLAGGVLILASGGTLALAAGAVSIASGVWGAGRGVQALYQRSHIGLSINPFTNTDARGIWINTVANASAAFAFGSATRLAMFTESAAGAITPVEASLHRWIQAGSSTLLAGSIGYDAPQLATNWDKMPAEDRALAMLSIGFWTAGVGVSMRRGGYGRGPSNIASLLADEPPNISSSELKWLRTGDYKMIYTYGENQIVAVARPTKPPSTIEDEFQLLEQLRELGLPTVNARKVTVDGKPAMVMERLGESSKDFVIGYNMKTIRRVGSSKYLNERSIGDLEEILRIMEEKGVVIRDLQFLIGEDGRAVIHDPMALPKPWNDTSAESDFNRYLIKFLIEEAKKRK